ncbi:MAG: lactate dehydrogenase [Zetaproteobacteria bacterium CG_4_9_14_3_um_filter_49_83]|nr:MAG: lactate dehydrogenase [Zetaproteobacteria bacterium CG17_big_fil_post_rev_8_21_14_2_50_50_13]PIY56100.1 MAG: lactate dehydrogenase [Zetaproteobacteria bacterium CG_4_10_14_0_8_um_filter_49_80]PJA34540.1 MAG: lactate dehydrogenase [Zetaproteobacteria bacterium CG_4_9_14_3_um_filter_49_83]
MNAVEIEEAISQLAEQDFDPEEFPFAFLEAFGNKATTIRRLKSKKSSSNVSDVEGGVLQRSNIHIAVCEEGRVTEILDKLKTSPATTKAKAKYILATDGITIESEDLTSGETVVCAYPHFPDHFGFFLSLAGISTVKEIRNNAIDIKATGRLNRLYVELLKDNPDWATESRRHDMNQFMTRLIFCFFAEDTDIFHGDDLFTNTIEQMSDSRSENTQHVLGELFRAMDIRPEEREAAHLPRWACTFPWVNGGLFAGCRDIPRFSRIARSYLLHAGRLDWKEINPDIFGSMIQAVADDEERGALGMHYTSVPNILKVLGPLFLDELREQLEQAGDNGRKLLNLRKRISKIRVFDPACGSGNFLVIAYIRLREIEAEIVRRRGEPVQRSWIRLENFYGIELKDFAAEVARLSLLIAEFQCDVRLIGQKEAKALMLPLKNTGQIRQGNALRIDWFEVCPPTTSSAKTHSDDLFHTPLDQPEIDFDNQGGETYICGNPPYKGSQTQAKEQKADLAAVFEPYGISSKQIDYVGGWFMKAAAYAQSTKTESAFVSTNSVCQGRIVPILWPKIFELGSFICFAHTSFKWANLAAHNAGVTVAIVGLSTQANKKRRLYDLNRDGETTVREVPNITPYLTTGENVIVTSQRNSIAGLHDMSFGNMPIDGGNLLMSATEVANLGLDAPDNDTFVRRIYGSAEFIRGLVRYCLWIPDERLGRALEIGSIRTRIDGVRAMRLDSKDAGTREMASRAHQFREMYAGTSHTLILPGVSSEGREYLPVGLLDNRCAVSNLAFALYDAPLWNMALIASRLHLVWIGTVCGKLKTDFRYSNTLGWNTFPVPMLTEKNKADLTACAEDILLAREAHFPATIAELYDPKKMPENLRHAHERNDEVLERIYIGRRFKNDTERLEKLFELYTKMAAATAKPAKKATGKKT